MQSEFTLEMTVVNTCTHTAHWAQHQLIMTDCVNVCQAVQHNDISLVVSVKAKDNEAGPGSNGRLVAVPAEDGKNLHWPLSADVHQRGIL